MAEPATTLGQEGARPESSIICVAKRKSGAI